MRWCRRRLRSVLRSSGESHFGRARPFAVMPRCHLYRGGNVSHASNCFHLPSPGSGFASAGLSQGQNRWPFCPCIFEMRPWRLCQAAMCERTRAEPLVRPCDNVPMFVETVHVMRRGAPCKARAARCCQGVRTDPEYLLVRQRRPRTNACAATGEHAHDAACISDNESRPSNRCERS